jgi:hypothetical protein
MRGNGLAECAKRNIPAIVAPLGMGAALLNFLPGHMTFESISGGRDAAARNGSGF